MDDIGAIQLRIKAEFKQLTGLLKTTDQTKRAVSLLAKDFARTGNLSKYMSGINQIDAANKKLGASSRMNRTQIMRFGRKVQEQTRFTDSLTAATQRLNAAQMASGKAMGNTRNKMNGSNMAVQQLGYQFGDFAVQVQGGTSAFVAFSQQGSQLAGILPMIAGPLGLSMGAAVGLSAALGILIPIGSAVGRMFMEMSEKGKKSAEELKTAFADMPAFFESVGLSISTPFTNAFDTIKKEYGAMFVAIAQERVETQKESALSIVPELEKSVSTFGFKKQMVDTFLVFGVENRKIFQAEKAHKKAMEIAMKDTVSDYKTLIEKAKSFNDVSSAVETTYEKLSVIDKGLADTFLKSAQARGIDVAIIKQLNLEKKAREEEKKATEEKAKEASELAEQEKLLGYQMIAISTQAREKRLKDVSELADAERLLGEQAVAATIKNINIEIEKRKKAAEERLSEEEKRKKAVLEGIAIFRAANKKAAAEKEELEKRAFNRRFEAEDQLMSMPLTVDKATQKKIDDAVELNRQQDDFLAKQQIQLGIATRISGQTGEELFAAQQINEMVLYKLELENLGLKLGDEKYNQAVTLKELAQEANARTFYRIQLEKEAAEAKRIADAEAQRVNDILLDQYSRIEQELEDQAQKQKGLADNIANTFGNAFMSIVDGTESAKHAFRSMARDIIKQLYQILVVEQMVNSISGAIQGSFGGAPQGPMPSGNAVPDTRMFKFANGGVVSSPTTFGMSGGKTGLMGEAGPEAIMPLKRGANGKLGVQMEGGGATTVVQNFNFSANGDDSVKRIIAQAAPKIAQMTKSEMLNDRRRGGTMKATFG